MFWGRCSSLPSFPSLGLAGLELASLALVPLAMLLVRSAARIGLARISLARTSLGLLPALCFRSIALSAAWCDLALRQQFETQRAGYRRRFYQTDVDHVPQPVHGTAARADQRMAGLVIVVI